MFYSSDLIKSCSFQVRTTIKPTCYITSPKSIKLHILSMNANIDCVMQIFLRLNQYSYFASSKKYFFYLTFLFSSELIINSRKFFVGVVLEVLKIEVLSINQIGSYSQQQSRKGMGQMDSKISIKQGELQKFGKVQYLVSSSPNQFVRMRVNLQINKNQKQLKQWKEKVQQLRKRPEITEFLVLPLEIQESNCLVCTNTNNKNLLTVYYEKMNLSLFQVIKNRKQFKKYFTEQEIWYLLYVLVKVGSFFQQQSDYIGNVHTTNVLLNDKSRIRLFTLYSSPTEQENFTKIRQSRHMDTFVAPEEIRFIHDDSFASINHCNRNKVDLFNIGLVLISTLMLKDCYNVYARTLFQLNEEKFTSTIQEMKSTHLNVRYSANLIHLIQAFLIVDPMLRKTPKYYYELLKKNELKILELQQFQFQLPTNKPTSNVLSPEVVHYLQKTSPNTRQSKYLSLAKKRPIKQAQIGSGYVLDQESQKNQFKEETKLKRKLFQE